MKRYALQSLVEASGMSEAALARRVGLSGTTLKQARTHGLVESAADRYAVRAGFTPWEVWPEWGDVSGRRRRQQAEWAKRKYNADPTHREQKREANRGYYEQARPAIRAAQRAYRQNNAEKVNAAKRAWYEANREAVLARRRELYRARNVTRDRSADADVAQPGHSTNPTCAPGSPQDSRDGVAA